MNEYHEEMCGFDPLGSSIFCIPSIPKHSPIQTINSTKSFSLGEALESYFPLLESVFQYLEASDLNSVRLVSPTWKSLSEREFQKRSFPTWVSVCYNPKLCLRVSQGFRYNTAAICIIVFDPDTIKLEKYICIHDSPEFNRMTFAEYLSNQVIPAGVDYCTIACSEVPQNVNEDACKVSIYQGIFVPFISKIRISMFHCNPKQIDRLSEFISSDEHVKCVLLFSQRYKVKVVEPFIKKLLQGKKPSSVALGGGLIKSIKTFMKSKTQKVFRADDLFCITFLQNNDTESDFNAYSAVINSDNIINYQYKKFEMELISLKQSSVLRTNGIIFRFCCCAKFCKAKETEIIAKHFPKYPILGLEVDGEIGWNTSNVQEEQKKSAGKSTDSPPMKKQNIIMPQTLHGWSTVLVLITWGKKI